MNGQSDRPVEVYSHKSNFQNVHDMADHLGPRVILLFLYLVLDGVSCRKAALPTSTSSPKPFPTAATRPQLVRPADISRPADNPQVQHTTYPPPKVDSSSLKPFYPPSKCAGQCYELSIRNSAKEEVLVTVMYWQQRDWFYKGEWKLKPGQVVHAANTDSTIYYVSVVSQHTKELCMEDPDGREWTFQDGHGDWRFFSQFRKSKKDWSPELMKVNCD